MRIERLVIASKNLDKVAEIEQILVGAGVVGEVMRGLDWSDVDETGATLEENALLKARAVVIATGLPALADDTGLEVEALDGAPGVHTARFAGPNATYQDNVTKMLEVMAGVVDRDATFRTVMAVAWPDGREMVAEGSLDGRIASGARGRGGFGYDPIFAVEHKTLAEMSSEEKNQISHRARSLRALIDHLCQSS